MKKTEKKVFQHYKVAKGRHLNINQMMKEAFRGKRDHRNKKKDKKRFAKPKTT